MRKKHWLWFVEEGGAHESFIKEMDIQLKPQFEELLDKKLNWDRIWLRSSDSRLINIEVNGKKRSVLSPIQLTFKSSWIKASLKWHCITEDKWIDMSDSINPGEIKFELALINDEFKDDFPTPNENIVMKELKMKTYFPVKMNTEYFRESGYFYIELENESEFQNLENTIDTATINWNDEEKIIDGRKAIDRGLVHNVGFESKEGNVYIIYYDIASASSYYFEYLAMQISENVKGIKSFIIGSDVE